MNFCLSYPCGLYVSLTEHEAISIAGRGNKVSTVKKSEIKNSVSLLFKEQKTRETVMDSRIVALSYPINMSPIPRDAIIY